jgi:cobalt/nickel transport system permease protein
MGSYLNLHKFIASEHQLEAKPTRGVFAWDPRLKLGILAMVIALNIGLAINWLSASLLIVGFLLVLWTRPPFGRTLIFFLAPLLATALAVVGFSVGFGKTPVYELGQFTVYKEGIIQGGEVAVRVYCDMTWLVLTFVTTPFHRIIEAFRWYKVPGILVDTLAMMYRYSFLLFDEFGRMYTASCARGGRAGKTIALKTVSRIGAQVFMRAFDRSERIHLSMITRGGQNTFGGNKE